MAYEHKMRHLVEFVDTDMAGIVHFANYFRYMEATEHEFLRLLGFSVHAFHEDGRTITFPRVSATCDYKSPLRFEDEFEVQLIVKDRREKSITYDFRFRKLSEETVIARGSITVVCVAVEDKTKRMKAIPIPATFDSIEVAPEAAQAAV